MSIPGLSGFNVSQIKQLMEQLQQLLASQQSGDPFGTQGNGGCFGNDQLAFQQILEEIQQLTSQLQAFGPEASGHGNSRDGRFNINIST